MRFFVCAGTGKREPLQFCGFFFCDKQQSHNISKTNKTLVPIYAIFQTSVFPK